ncbi:MAG: hypothetical protein II998_06635 [Clostridia bacterium]|nr:hypothetical protein [Clostridia bacterium]
MKKFLSIILALLMVLSLAACSGDANKKSGKDSAAQDKQEEIKAAVEGVLTVGIANAAIEVNNTSVPMPYILGDLESAGVPVDESVKEVELASGDFFSANLYLDEEEEYLIIPAYYNAGDDAINIADAQAEGITMTTYSDEPADQGVSIFGVTFGMAKSDILTTFGEPMYDGGDYLEWEVAVSDSDYTGSFTVYFTGDEDSALVSQVNLGLIK